MMRVLAVCVLALVTGCDQPAEKRSTPGAATTTSTPTPPVAAPRTPAKPARERGLVSVSNDRCPLMPEHALNGRLALPEHTRAFKNQTIGFCCDDCAQGWDALSDDDREAALATARDFKPGL